MNQTASFTSISGTTSGDQFLVTFDITGFVANQGAAGIIMSGATTRKNNGLSYWYPNSIGTHTTVVDVTGSSITLNLHAGTQVGVITKFDNISVRKLSELDRSYNNTDLTAKGTVTKTAVATGAELVGYSGFSTSNYLEQSYTGDLDFGDGDFSMSWWCKTDDASGNMSPIEFSEPDQDSDGDPSVLSFTANGYMRFYTRGTSGGWAYITSDTLIAEDVWESYTLVKTNDVKYLYRNGELTASAADTKTVTSSSTIVRVGLRSDGAGGPWNGSIALARISATAPSAKQIKEIYNDEKHLFATNAKATLYGSSDAVTALAYDDDTELLHVGTSAGRSEFQGLNRVNNTTDAVGTAISASNGLVAED